MLNMTDGDIHTQIANQLAEKGFAVIKNVLTPEEVKAARLMFDEWRASVPNLDRQHNIVDPHGIYKHHEVGHQRHAWFVRTRPRVQEIFQKLWDTDELVVSFDGSCYISHECRKKDNCWTHTDQAPNKKGRHCIQGFVALTSNKERTLVVYEGSHLLHEKYFEENEIKGTKNWFKFDEKYIASLKSRKRVLHVPAGALVLWESRTYHQNQYGNPGEERLVQYVSYLPKNNSKNTKQMQEKRKKYFEERRTTSHWAYPISVNAKQPQTYGDKSRELDYSILPRPNLEDMIPEIEKLI